MGEKLFSREEGGRRLCEEFRFVLAKIRHVREICRSCRFPLQPKAGEEEKSDVCLSKAGWVLRAECSRRFVISFSAKRFDWSLRARLTNRWKG